MKIRFIILLLLCASILHAQEDKTTQRLDSLMHLLEQHDRMMGSVAISKGGNPFYSRSIGHKDAGQELIPDSNTKFRIGSITKMFTATVIFQLTEENKLTPETLLSAFFPEIPNANEITISHLLGHQSGLFNITNSPDYITWNATFHSRNDLLDRIIKVQPTSSPGSTPSYSNSNYILLTFIIEDLTGKPYKEVIKERITDKINLQNTSYGDKIDVNNNEALSYRFIGNGWQQTPETNVSVPLGAGAMISTPADLNKFIEGLFNGQLISKASLDQMMSFTGPYGLGIFQFPFYEKIAYGHTGGIDGFNAVLAYFPEDKLAVAITSNGAKGSINDILIGILSITYQKPYEFPSYTSIHVDEDQLKKYEGVFSSAQLPIKLDIRIENGNLTAQGTNQPRLTLEATAPHEFTFRDAGAVFIFKEEKEFTELVLKQSGQQYLFSKED